MAAPQQRRICVLQLANTVTGVQHSFHTISHGTTQLSINRAVVDSLCVLQLWAVFGLPFNIALKYQRAERVVSCSYHKQPSPE
jgi:hypothetical protein